MAGSRLEKIGTIYSRAYGLIQSGAKRWEDRPLWFNLYEAFPPKEEPRFDRPVPNLKLRQIFYPEDRIRAMFHKHNENVGLVNMSKSEEKTLTQKFIDCYHTIESKYEEKGDTDKIYKEALELLKRQSYDKNEIESITSNSGIAEDKGRKPVKINIDSIFK